MYHGCIAGNLGVGAGFADISAAVFLLYFPHL